MNFGPALGFSVDTVGFYLFCMSCAGTGFSLGGGYLRLRFTVGSGGTMNSALTDLGMGSSLKKSSASVHPTAKLAKLSNLSFFSFCLTALASCMTTSA